MWEKIISATCDPWQVVPDSVICRSWLRIVLENPASNSRCKTFEKDMHDEKVASNINTEMKLGYLYEDRLWEWKFRVFFCADVCACGGSSVCMCVLQSELMGNSEASTQLIIRQESRQQCSHCSFFESTHCDLITSTLWGEHTGLTLIR